MNLLRRRRRSLITGYREAPALTIRVATWADVERLEDLAALDEDQVPPAPLLLAFVGEELWAALSLSSGDVIADPFRPSAQIAQLVAARARQLTVDPADRAGLRSRRATAARPVPRASQAR